MTHLSAESLGLDRMAFLWLLPFQLLGDLFTRHSLSIYCVPDSVLRAWE